MDFGHLWPWTGLGAGSLLFVLLTTNALRSDRSTSRWRDIGWLTWAAVCAYLLHQFEEHGIDAQGDTYAFRGVLCANIGFANAGTCPVPTTQTPTINYNRVSSMFYLDVGLNWNYSPKTQFYTKIDNVANTRPPDIGGQDNNQVLYDVIGRMFRFGVRYNY